MTSELIQGMADGVWDPTGSPSDQAHVKAMVTKGYHNAFKEVIASVVDIFRYRLPGHVIERDLHRWYRALFSPSMQANIISASALAG